MAPFYSFQASICTTKGGFATIYKQTLLISGTKLDLENTASI